MSGVEPGPRPRGPRFAENLGKWGQQVAVVGAQGSATYGDLAGKADQVASVLGPARRLVLVPADNSLDALVNYLGALRGGHVVLFTGPEASTSARLLDEYDPDIVLPLGGPPVVRRVESAHVLHPDLCLLLSTSGSTGSPKLVRLSRTNLQSNAEAISEYLELTPDDRAATSLPMQYSYGLSVVNSHLNAGASLLLTDLSVVDPCFWEVFESSGATSFAGVPHTFDLLDRIGFESMQVPNLRYVTQAGGHLSAEQVRRYAALGRRGGWKFFVMYGQTEATARIAYLPPELAEANPRAVGVPIPGGALRIDSPDETGVGELVYRGPNVMLGYAESAADLAAGRTIEELHTGDMARRTPTGLFEIVGRRSRILKIHGLRIDLDHVERVLQGRGIVAACTGTDELVIIAVERPADVESVEAVTTDGLHLPRLRTRVVSVESLPRLPGGKPDYARVEQLADASHVVPPARADAGSDVAGAVRAAFADILGVEPAPDDTFVDLGGDSLSYVEMSIRLEAVLGPLPRDWHVTSVGNLMPTGRSRFVARTDTSAVLRAVAICLIVATHANLVHLPGGAHLLLAIAGFNFARFGTDARRLLVRTARIAIPSMCWIAGVAAVSDKYGWPNALLINAFVERPGDEWGYWFIEALVVILLVLAATLAIPALARLDHTARFVLPGLALASGLVFRFDLVRAEASFPHARPHEVFWLFALGWAAARCTSWTHRLVVSAVAVAAVPGFFGDGGREAIILGGMLLVMWVPTVGLPRPTERLVAPVAGASLYIYLTHFQTYPPLDRLAGPAAAVVGAIWVGILVWWIARRLIEFTEQQARRVRISPL